MKTKKKGFKVQIRSRHGSHAVLRAGALRMPYRTIIRFGSSTELPDTVANGGKRVEVNTVAAIKNSSNKMLMKKCFSKNEVKTAIWWTLSGIRDGKYSFAQDGVISEENVGIDELSFPIISKTFYGSRGEGNTKHNTKEELAAWIAKNNYRNCIFEKYYNYSREYRLHVTEDGCFYTCRKMLKKDTPDERKWFRNDSNCVWMLEENELFDKPVNWDVVIEQSVNALKSVGLDFGAVDLRIQSATDDKGVKRTDPDFIIVEINSAPSFGERTAEKYKEMLPTLINKKYAQKR